MIHEIQEAFERAEQVRREELERSAILGQVEAAHRLGYLDGFSLRPRYRPLADLSDAQLLAYDAGHQSGEHDKRLEMEKDARE